MCMNEQKRANKMRRDQKMRALFFTATPSEAGKWTKCIVDAAFRRAKMDEKRGRLPKKKAF